MRERSLAGQVAVVTGGAAGMGCSIVELFARAGARIVAGDVNAGVGLRAVQAVQKKGGDAIFVECDVANEDDAQRLMNATLATFGRLDILVNNAGIYREASVVEMLASDWDAVLQVNLRGTFLCSRAALPPMLKQKSGTIINVASRSGNKGQAFASAYAASKAGIIAFTYSLAAEVKELGIRVNAICPGMVRTAMGANSVVIPGERWIERDEIARLALFLASDDSSAIHGAAINAYG